MSEIAGDSSASGEKILKPDRKRNVSGEIDVFEATRYFSDFNESATMMMDSRMMQKQNSNVTEHRQNRVHPHTEDQLLKTRVAVKSSPPSTVVTRGGGKLTSFLNSLLRSAGFKKAKSSPESKLKTSKKIEILVEETKTKKKRRQSFVVTQSHFETISPMIVPRRRSFDEKHLKKNDEEEESLKIRSSESLSLDKKVQSKEQNKIDDGFESDSSAESDLFELDLFAKSNRKFD